MIWKIKLLTNPLILILLLSDGSLTRNLQIITNSNILISAPSFPLYDNFGMFYFMKDLSLFNIRREICLIDDNKDNLVYAISWWKIPYNNIISSLTIPIGNYFIYNEIDTYKDIYLIEIFKSDFFEKIFSYKGPFFCRYYFLWKDKTIEACFFEVFSPKIAKYFSKF
nr:hypothetical protein [Boldiaceae sp.]